MIKYRAQFGEIKPVEVAGETDKFVILKSGRRSKKTADDGWEIWRDTFEEAKAEMLKFEHGRLDMAKRNVARAEEKIAEIEALEEGEVE